MPKKDNQNEKKGKVRKAASMAKAGAKAVLRVPMRVLPMRATPGPRRVAITGMGTVNALGHDVPTTFEAFREGRCGISELNIRDVDRLAIRIGAQVHDWNPETYFNRQQILLYDKFTQFTLLAARQAVLQSGLDFDGDLGLMSGVVLGTAAALFISLGTTKG